ncbi:MAG TPA: hypothetical protein VGE40_04165 [Bacilli bacterium]
MSTALEKVAPMTDSLVIKDVRFGKFTIANVPHVRLSQPTPNGEKLIREILIDIKLSEIYDYMKENNIGKVDFSSYNQV